MVMRRSQAHSSCRLQLPLPVPVNHCLPSNSRVLLSLLLGLLAVSPSRAQDTGTAATEFHGKGVAISVVVHAPSGESISSPTMVKLFRGTIPAGQAETTIGRADFVVTDVGDFTVVVQA